MSYRNRIKKPNRHLNPPYWFNKRRGESEGFNKSMDKWYGKTGHKVPYIRKRYSESIDPITGKYHGWKDVPFKKSSLKKRYRRAGKELIMTALVEMTHAICLTCGSEFCENHKSCADEEAMYIEHEIEMYSLYGQEREEEEYYEDMYEELYEDPYYYGFDY